MPRYLVALAAVAVALASPAGAVAAAPHGTAWASQQIAYVVRNVPGVAATGAFNGNQPLDAGTLYAMVAAVPDQPQLAPPADPSQPVTVTALDRAFVGAVKLRGVAASVDAGLANAGLSAPPSAGIEVVARTLGFRSTADPGSPWPTAIATRAEGAYTAWKVMTESNWEPPYVRQKLAALTIPAIPVAAMAPLRRAVAEIGAPYLWAGTAPADGGFDCSGLVVFAEQNASWLGGRSTMQMARASTAQRVPATALAAGDVVLFGKRGPATAPAGIYHAGLVLGGGWYIHSSNQGVTLERLDASWVAPNIAYGLRPPGA